MSRMTARKQSASLTAARMTAARIVRARRLLRRVAQPGWSDRGGVAVLVSVLVASGVLLGMAGLSVDVGQLMAEREELMSAADGAAQSIAWTCAKTPAKCEDGAPLDGTVAAAQVIANDNGKDGLNGITMVCGRGGGLPPCDPTQEPTNLTACLGSPPAAANYVEVHTSTHTKDGTLLPTAFAGAFVPGYRGGRVGACSRVEWGPPGGGLSLTFAKCEWDADTDGGASYVSYPPDPPASAERVIYLHGKSASSCTNTPPSGWDAPGGFGWLDPDDPPACYTSIDAGGSYPGNTGNNTPDDCLDRIAAAQQAHTVVLLPVYDGTQGNGSNLTYHAAGVAAFVITGYYFGNGNGGPAPKQAASWLTGDVPCGDKNSDDRCVSGFFVSALLDVSVTIGSGDPLGAIVIKTVG